MRFCFPQFPKRSPHDWLKIQCFFTKAHIHTFKKALLREIRHHFAKASASFWVQQKKFKYAVTQSKNSDATESIFSLYTCETRDCLREVCFVWAFMLFSRRLYLGSFYVNLCGKSSKIYLSSRIKSTFVYDGLSFSLLSVMSQIVTNVPDLRV